MYQQLDMTLYENRATKKTQGYTLDLKFSETNHKKFHLFYFFVYNFFDIFYWLF
jgi:hypothetical protein